MKRGDGMDKGVYRGYLIKGDLRGAMSYLKQFPEQAALYERFSELYERERYITCDEVDAELNGVLLAYQRYYRDVFYLGVGRERAADALRDRLVALSGADGGVCLDDLEQGRLVELFAERGLHFLGGRTLPPCRHRRSGRLPKGCSRTA